MKKCITTVSGIVLVACFIVSGSGCTSKNYTETSLTGTIPPPVAGCMPLVDSPQDIPKKEIIRQTFVHKASIKFLAYEVKDVFQGCEKVIKDNSGLVEKSAFSGDWQIIMTVRIPSSAFDKALSALEKYGNVNSKNIETEDVSGYATDLGAELKSKTVLRDRFRELLKDACDIEDAICIEENLARLQADIDRLQAALNSLNYQIEYSTINIQIDKVDVEKKTVYGPLSYVFIGIVWGIEKLFVISR